LSVESGSLIWEGIKAVGGNLSWNGLKSVDLLGLMDLVILELDHEGTVAKTIFWLKGKNLLWWVSTDLNELDGLSLEVAVSISRCNLSLAAALFGSYWCCLTLSLGSFNGLGHISCFSCVSSGGSSIGSDIVFLEIVELVSLHCDVLSHILITIHTGGKVRDTLWGTSCSLGSSKE